MLVRVETFQHDFGFDRRHVHQIYIMYQRTKYMLFGYVPSPQYNMLRVMYYPSEATHKAFEHIWTTLAVRYNHSSLVPVPAQLASVSAYSTGIFSLKRTEHAICYLVPLKSKRPLEYVLIFPFDQLTWLLLALVVLLTMILLWRCPGSSRNLIEIIFELVQSVLSSPNLHIGSSFERNILQIFMFAVLIFVSTYLSLITAFIATPFYYNEYATVDQINKTCNVALGFVQDTYKFDFNHEVDFFKAVQNNVPVCVPVSCKITHRSQKIYPMGKVTFFLSQARSHQQPLLGVVANLEIAQLVQFIASTFVEGELFHFDENGKLSDRDESMADQLKPFGLNDLRIVWRLTINGWILSVFVFVFELLKLAKDRVFPDRPLVFQ